jgi:orotidine-5'-phosphate decarboxylase
MTTSLEVDIPIAVALDFADERKVIEVAEATKPHVGVFKVGLTTIYGAFPGIVRRLGRDRPVLLDAKLHDIPVQVEGAVSAMRNLGASLVTVHASAGLDAVKAAVAAAGDDLIVIAVTVLTSIDDGELEHLGIRGPAEGAVARLADRALAAGAPGLVCSPREVGALRSRFGSRSDGGPLLVVPGVRPPQTKAGDQRRTLTPEETRAAGADLLVIGRPITEAPDPTAAARDIAASLEVVTA